VVVTGNLRRKEEGGLKSKKPGGFDRKGKLSRCNKRKTLQRIGERKDARVGFDKKRKS